MDAIKVILADDHLLVRNGIKSLLENEDGIEVIGEAADGEEALEKTKMLKPDVLILDIRMPKMNGIEAVKYLKKYSPKTKALMLTMNDAEEYVLQAIEYGATGYVLKDANEEEFITAIKKVNSGEKYFTSAVSDILAINYIKSVQESKTNRKGLFELTKKEKEILQLIAQGMSSRDISNKLESSIRTVQVHRFNIMKKMQVKNVVELINIAQDYGLIE
ncbi:response regulator transcription factor [Chondrinema litorale]|uniref:response regulator transcription factor n=1 Tax=Chondrinema litorale TaxID=2994555 RepID=UPI002542B0CA|nr:response regulator transcription factor [Chondrinema litorale]UZR95599.1 response regulator transcription factor [Chondrinema litorale]